MLICYSTILSAVAPPQKEAALPDRPFLSFVLSLFCLYCKFIDDIYDDVAQFLHFVVADDGL